MKPLRPLPALLFLLLIGCANEGDSPVEPAPLFENQWRIRLSNLVLETTIYDTVQVEIMGVAPQAVDSVVGVITTPFGQLAGTFRLYDDASAYSLNDASEFASTHSGDLVANNGRFTRLINSHFADSAGTYYLAVQAWRDHEIAWTPQDTFLVSLSLPPQVSNLNLPDTLYSGFPPFQIGLQAFDPDAAFGDSVVSVQMRLYSSSGAFLGDPIQLTALDQINYGHTISADFAVGLDSNFYTFAFRAYDTFNMISDSLGRSVYIENVAPYLADPFFSDTVVTLPLPGDTTSFLASVRAWDDQTAEDIVEIYIQALKPDSTFGSIVELFDDGQSEVSGDEVAGDSTFTRIISIWPNNLLGLYVFHFRGLDQAGNQREITQNLWVIP